MKYAVVSDIHSNKVAFEEVLSELEEQEYDKLICCGDVIGYNPWPAECIELVREYTDIVVQGNHDRDVATPDEYATNKMAFAGLKHAQEQLSEEQFEWVTTLPRRMEFEGGDGLVVHDHPEEVDTYVYPRDFARMRPYMDTYDVMLLGHTHIQHKAVIDGRLIVNPGSVGQPRDKNADAAYAIIDTDENEVEMYRAEYDISKVEDAVKTANIPEETAARLYFGE